MIIDRTTLAKLLASRRILLTRLLVLLWASCCLLVLAGSLIPGFGPPKVFSHFDKFMHFSAWLLLGVLTQFLFRHTRWPLVTALGLFFMSAGIELLQHFIPGRSASILDLVANGSGIAIGTVSALLAMRHLARLRGPQTLSETSRDDVASRTAVSEAR